MIYTDKKNSSLTKENAKELDIIFENLLLWEKKRSSAYLNIFEVTKSISTLKDKSDNYIRSLLYIARQEQRNFSELFSGDTLIALHEPSVRDFLAQGGFKALYNRRRKTILKDDFRFWSIFIITVVTLIVTIYQVLHS